MNTDVSTDEVDYSEHLRAPAFRRLWFANGLLDIADNVAAFALPATALLFLHASVLWMSVIAAMPRIGPLLLGLSAGAWVDRWPKKRVLVCANIVSMLAVGSIPVAYACHALTAVHLACVAFVIGIADFFFSAAHTAILPMLLPKRAVAEATAKLQATDSLMGSILPTVSGAFARAVPGPIMYLICSAAHLGSALSLRAMPTGAARLPAVPGQRRKLREEIGEGLSLVWGNPLLRMMLVQASLNNFAIGTMAGVMPYVLFTTLGLNPILIGISSSLVSAAALVWLRISRRLRARMGEIRLFAMSSYFAFFPVVPLLMALHSRSFDILLVVVSQMAIMLLGITRATASAGLRARVSTRSSLGRISASNMVIAMGATLAGTVGGGLVSDAFSVKTAMFVSLCFRLVPAMMLALSPFRAMRMLPPEWEVDG